MLYLCIYIYVLISLDINNGNGEQKSDIDNSRGWPIAGDHGDPECNPRRFVKGR